MTQTQLPDIEVIKEDEPIKHLIMGTRNGDEECFALLLTAVKEKSEKLLLSKFPQRSCDIDDAIQATNLKVWQNIEKFDGTAQFSTWYIRIAINSMLDILKKNKKHQTNRVEVFIDKDGEEQDFMLYNIEAENSHEYAPSPRDILSEEERSQEILDAIKKCAANMKEKYVKILHLIFLENKSYKETSEALSIPIGTVMSQVFYTREKLKKMLSKVNKPN